MGPDGYFILAGEGYDTEDAWAWVLRVAWSRLVDEPGWMRPDAFAGRDEAETDFRARALPPLRLGLGFAPLAEHGGHGVAR